ncbi:MAG TPA: hypothetical protein VFC19_30730 [Candidatus Limnocylindrales bacterium]|nr:hypothetical protein [Candidatus Limnocylindrales bacterium]
MTDRPDFDFDSQLLDPQLLEFARRFDPARHLPDAPPVSAEQIRRNAERREAHEREWRANPLSRPLHHFWLPAVCVAGILVLTVVGVAVLRPYLGPGLTGSPPTSPSPSPSRPAGPARPALLDLPAPNGAAKQMLEDLADVAAKQTPRTPAMFIYVRRQVWVAGPATEPAVVATDVQTWLRGDLSGYEQKTTLPPQPAGVHTAQWTQQLPAENRPTLQTHAPGGYAHPIPSPSLQAGLLAAQIGKAYGYHVAAGVADLFQLGLEPAQREAALQVFAAVTNLAHHGRVKDRASRTGIAFTSTDPGTGVREVLIFHPDTGELLDYEKWVSGPDGEIFVDAYTLYLDIRTTNSRP